MGVRFLGEYLTCLLGYLHLTELGDAPGALTPSLLTEYLTEATVEHSRYRPRLVTDATLDGTGSAIQFRLDNLVVPYEDGLSALAAVEYPVGETPPAFLVPPEGWRVLRNASGQAVVQFGSAPAAGTNNIRLEYTARHALTAAASTVEDADFYAVCHLAAAYALLSVAGRAAHRVQPSISVDDGGPRTASDVYRAVAKEHRAAYFAHLGMTEKEALELTPVDLTARWLPLTTWDPPTLFARASGTRGY